MPGKDKPDIAQSDLSHLERRLNRAAGSRSEEARKQRLMEIQQNKQVKMDPNEERLLEEAKKEASGLIREEMARADAENVHVKTNANRATIREFKQLSESDLDYAQAEKQIHEQLVRLETTLHRFLQDLNKVKTGNHSQRDQITALKGIVSEWQQDVKLMQKSLPAMGAGVTKTSLDALNKEINGIVQSHDKNLSKPKLGVLYENAAKKATQQHPLKAEAKSGHEPPRPRR